MNKIQFLFLFMIVSSLVLSCSKDNQPSKSTFATRQFDQNLIIGKWAISSISSIANSTAKVPSFESKYTGKKGDYYEFKADGSVKVWQDGIEYNSKYTVNKNQIIFTLKGDLTIYMTIAELTAHELELKRNVKNGIIELVESRTLNR